MRQVADDLDGLTPLRRRAGPPRQRRASTLPWFRMAVVCAAMVAGLAYLAGQQPQPSADPVSIPLAPLIAPPPAWERVSQPVPLYALDGIPRGSFALDVRRHIEGGREDTLTFGSFGDTGFGLLRMTRGVSEPEPTSFYVLLVRQAAQAGLSVVRSTQAAPLATKFGPAEIAEVTMMGMAGETAADPSEATCVAWRVAVPEAQFALSGWVCGSVDQPADAAQVACLIDRLTMAGGEDAGLKVLFAQAEQRRIEACRPPAPRVASVRKP